MKEELMKLNAMVTQNISAEEISDVYHVLLKMDKNFADIMRNRKRQGVEK